MNNARDLLSGTSSHYANRLTSLFRSLFNREGYVSLIRACHNAFTKFRSHEPELRTLPSGKHSLTSDKMSPQAKMVMERLVDAGYAAYLVGGSVRDVMVSLKPKDFDVVTDATPEQVRRTFRQSRIIGRRFRLVHVYGRGDIIEVSTFRANSQSVVHVANDDNSDEMPMVVDDNTYGTIEEDAWRRDFTINALFYCHADKSIVDFTGGVRDMKLRLVRMIGDASQRFHEDPVRLLRAIRMAAKLNFKVEKKTYQALLELPGLLQHVAPARLFDEVGKFFFTGHAISSYEWLLKTGYCEHLFPNIYALVHASPSPYRKLIQCSMEETDARFQSGKSLSPGYLFCVLYWPIVQEHIKAELKKGARVSRALATSFKTALESATQQLAVPKRHQVMMKAVWSLQYHLERQRPSRIDRLLEHRYCRAAVDLLELRVRAGWSEGAELADTWRQRLNALPSRENHKRPRRVQESRGRLRGGSARKRRPLHQKSDQQDNSDD